MFVGTRVVEIQDMTEVHYWRYVDSANNPADDITRGKTLAELATPGRWSQGPSFLQESPERWPVTPLAQAQEDPSETRTAVFYGLILNDQSTGMPDAAQYTSWGALVEATFRFLHGVATPNLSTQYADHRSVGALIVSRCQEESFPEEFKALKSAKLVPASSRLNTLAPEFDHPLELIRVGGRLRRLGSCSSIMIL